MQLLSPCNILSPQPLIWVSLPYLPTYLHNTWSNGLSFSFYPTLNFGEIRQEFLKVLEASWQGSHISLVPLQNQEKNNNAYKKIEL